ncbi:MAG: metalloregulator ArsR/SmtB family transcription factor [Candidatus Nanoarchaeia archaeon]|nr:metalloregulator ArsR/SmtB family transcription factor [Candidatus Nanoarchaeia archaeon]MDD5741618.1 metalloregulator ArsR/SmtB family transcription factor [Candidatus Nanoarchaeia archaeon]
MKYSTYHVFFSKLSNPLRIKIISSLDERPKSVNELIEGLKVEQSKISHALKELKECNIVKAEKKGKKRIYSLSGTIIPILRLIDCHAKNCNKCRGCVR